MVSLTLEERATCTSECLFWDKCYGNNMPFATRYKVDSALLNQIEIEIIKPDDWHVHLREGDMLQAVIGYTSQRFRYAMVMPNLSTPVATTQQAAMYLQQIHDATPPDSPDFRPLMTLYRCEH